MNFAMHSLLTIELNVYNLDDLEVDIKIKKNLGSVLKKKI